MFQLPHVVRNKVVSAGAQGWLAALPDLVTNLAEEWSLEVGKPLDGGTESIVLEATTSDGVATVLKLLLPRSDDAAHNEITALRLAGGEGCARLHRADAMRGALLLERLGRRLGELGLPIDRRHEVLCAAATRVWRRAPDCGLPTGAEKGRWLIEYITTVWERLDRPCSEAAIAHAVACAERRVAAHDDGRAVLVHGDVHQWNALESSDGFKLVDPDGLLAEAEYDMGIVMREDPVELLAGDPWARAHRLASLTGLDATAIWEWGAVERVSTGLLCVEVDLQPAGRDMLLAADHVVGAD